jgi:DNA-binding response OmpR family regulator
MPVDNGFQVMEKLKAHEQYAGIPVMFLTAKDDKQSIIKCMELGAVDYILKPFTDENLINSINFYFEPNKNDENKPVILAVDDNPAVLKTVHFLLKDDYMVYILAQPEKLSKLLGLIKPDLFLLDYKMPVIDGFNLIPIIRKVALHEDTPIVFLTSEGTVDTLSAAIHLGACDFIVKPVDETVLKEKLALHLKNYIMQRRIRSLGRT